MRDIFLLLLFISNISYCQRNFFENVCTHNFNENLKTKSSNIKYFVPCDWEEEKELVMPDLLKLFKFSLDKNTGLILTIGIKELNVSLSNEELNSIYTEDFYRNTASKWGEHLSGRKYKIDNRYVAEITFDTQTNNPTTHLRTIILYISCSTKLAFLSFIVKSNSGSVTNSIFNQYQPLFIYLFAKTKVQI